MDLALYLKKEQILIIGDIHLGYEESLSQQGVLVPRFQLEETIKRLEKILKKLKIKEVVITGDLKHEFGKILYTESRDTLQFLDFLLKKYKVTIIKGNHDTILTYIVQKRDIELKQYYKINNFFICHGDRLMENLDFFNSNTIIIGHEHPAISISKNSRSETFKCFLIGKYKNKNLIVMPSFNILIEGSNILKEKLLSPFLKKSNLDDFEIYVVADKIYNFGKLKNVKS
ncbi:metallophosphoesterase [Candidatus Woesearchaeota archaeon]|nr:metallophosphoesterase [Candidatus Woesearchaeota archaeon]